MAAPVLVVPTLAGASHEGLSSLCFISCIARERCPRQGRNLEDGLVWREVIMGVLQICSSILVSWGVPQKWEKGEMWLKSKSCSSEDEQRGLTHSALLTSSLHLVQAKALIQSLWKPWAAELYPVLTMSQMTTQGWSKKMALYISMDLDWQILPSRVSVERCNTQRMIRFPPRLAVHGLGGSG